MTRFKTTHEKAADAMNSAGKMLAPNYADLRVAIATGDRAGMERYADFLVHNAKAIAEAARIVFDSKHGGDL